MRGIFLNHEVLSPVTISWGETPDPVREMETTRARVNYPALSPYSSLLTPSRAPQWHNRGSLLPPPDTGMDALNLASEPFLSTIFFLAKERYFHDCLQGKTTKNERMRRGVVQASYT